MKILLGIDDTDNMESIGTGALLEKLCAELAQQGIAKHDFITRHQLFIHEDIAYTSHNSSMCCELKIEKDDLESVICFAQEYLVTNSAEGSDPGLCVVCYKKIESCDELIKFGQAAKEEVLQKADAYEMAEKYPGTVFLSEHGGTGDGVIGAIAGCGLRLSGMDGKIKRKIHPEDPDAVMTVGEFCNKFGMSWALDENFNEVSFQDTVKCGKAVKMFLWKNKNAVILAPDETEGVDWSPVGKKKAH